MPCSIYTPNEWLNLSQSVKEIVLYKEKKRAAPSVLQLSKVIFVECIARLLQLRRMMMFKEERKIEMPSQEFNNFFKFKLRWHFGNWLLLGFGIFVLTSKKKGAINYSLEKHSVAIWKNNPEIFYGKNWIHVGNCRSYILHVKTEIAKPCLCCKTKIKTPLCFENSWMMCGRHDSNKLLIDLYCKHE